MPRPRKEAERHLTEEELADAIDDAQSAENTRLVRRLCFIRNLYKGDSVTEAADRVGVAQPTGSRWVEAWNAGGIDGLKPDFGDGRPSKLTEQEQEQLTEILKGNQPLTTQQIQQIIEEGFDVSYSQRHIPRLLKKLGMKYAIPRPTKPEQPDEAEEILEENLQAALDELDDDIVTDGGFVLGFLDESWPRPTDNSRRLWSFEKPTLAKQTPTANFDDAVFGSYALLGESVVACKPDITKESVGEFFPPDQGEQS
jgi:transposase